MFYGLFDYPGRRPDGPWHEDETAALLAAWRRGDTLEELAERHHRPVEAIVRRLRDRGETESRPNSTRSLGFPIGRLQPSSVSRG